MSTKTELRSGRTAVTALCLVFAAGYLVIGFVRHDAWLVVAAPLIMLGYLVALFAFRSRSEPVSLLAGTRGDERQQQVTLRAGAFTANVTLAAVLIGFFWALAIGATTVANVLSVIAAIGGLSFGGAVVWYSRHA